MGKRADHEPTSPMDEWMRAVEAASKLTPQNLAKYLTKRELAAMLAMRELLRDGYGMSIKQTASEAVAAADALIAELAKGGEG